MLNKVKYLVKSKEFGRGPTHTMRFYSLAELQAYVKSQWQGVEYMDGKSNFHTDYCTFELVGATLYDLGSHAGTGDEYWDWLWKEVN